MYAIGQIVLIDTWWNVNGDADQTGYVKIEVLIDT